MLGWRDHVYLQRIIQVGKELLGDDIDYRYDQLIFKPPYNVLTSGNQTALPRRGLSPHLWPPVEES
jgi:hypothetical protein